MRAKRAGKPPPNPFSNALAMFAFTTLGIVGLGALLGFDALLDWSARPLLLGCALLVVAYTIAAIRLGSIALIDHIGRVLHYDRSREPVLFWMLVLLYLGLALPTAYYMCILLIDS